MNRQQAEELRLNPDHWYLGAIYLCSQDPRVFVRNRWLFGWTWNFANKHVLWVLPLVLGLLALPLILITLEIIAFGLFSLVAYYAIYFIGIVFCAAHIARGPE